MKIVGVCSLKQRNKEELKETIKILKKQNLETRVSLYNEFVKISNIGHSNDINKNIKIIDIVDKVIKDMWQDLENDIFINNNEEGNII